MSVELAEIGSRSRVRCAAAAVVVVWLVGCDTHGDPGVPDATSPECPNCPVDPYRDVPANCSLQTGVDTLPVETFDNHTVSTGAAGAQDLYVYTDGTSVIRVEDYVHAVEVVGMVSDAGMVASGFEPPVGSISPCDPSNDDGFIPGAFHIFGGSFRGWGGGVGVSMAKLNGRDPITGNADQHPTDDPRAPKAFCCVSRNAGQCVATTDPKFAALCPPADAEFAPGIGAVDVSQYEGVSFWARRGPTSQMGLRVLIGDKYTDDDLNYLAQRQQATTGQAQALYCQRVRECDCRIGQTCSFYGEQDMLPLAQGQPAGFYCSQPQAAPTMTGTGPNCGGQFGGAGSPISGGTPISGAGPSNCCDTTGCNAVYPAYPTDPLPNTGRFVDAGAGTSGDVQFYDRPCTPFGWANGLTGSWCFDPATDPPPASPNELCGDHWTRTVDLSTEWQFYTVPFTDMRQQGWAKKSEHLDLHSVSTLRFSWDVGNIDYWIDDVSFYRRTQ